jgi:hypothetical protein
MTGDVSIWVPIVVALVGVFSTGLSVWAARRASKGIDGLWRCGSILDNHLCRWASRVSVCTTRNAGTYRQREDAASYSPNHNWERWLLQYQMEDHGERALHL